MRKTIFAFRLVAFAAMALSGAKLKAQTDNVILPNLPRGTLYQIIFATSSGTFPNDSNIADYNSFVTSEANRDGTLHNLMQEVSFQWNAIVSTPTVNANSNAMSSGLVYNTQGQLVASPSSPLYSGTILTPVEFNQFGGTEQTFIWTGSTPGGNVLPGFALGGSSGNYEGGVSTSSDSSWLTFDSQSFSYSASIYALSTPIFAPEPATFTLFGSAILLLGAFRWRKMTARLTYRGAVCH
jgi:hypothetical protein